MWIYFIVLASASLVTFFAIQWFIQRAPSLGLVDRNAQKNSAVASGVGMLLIFLAIIAELFLVDSAELSQPGMGFFFPGLIMIVGLGFYDDLFGLSPLTRLLAQAAVSAVTVYFFQGLPVLDLSVYTIKFSLFWAYILPFLGLIWAMNLFNFMDGADGYLGWGVCLPFFMTSYLFIQVGAFFWAKFSFILALLILVFLYFNKPPASCYMGDAGAYALGYCYGFFAFWGQRYGQVSMLCWLIMIYSFLIDGSLVTFSRIYLGKPFERHYEFLHHRLLLHYGWKPRSLLHMQSFQHACVLFCLFLSPDITHPSLKALSSGFLLLTLLYIVLKNDAAQGVLKKLCPNI
jgi:Fuc2NAc and GlcNAc transferase